MNEPGKGSSRSDLDWLCAKLFVEITEVLRYSLLFIIDGSCGLSSFAFFDTIYFDTVVE